MAQEVVYCSQCGFALERDLDIDRCPSCDGTVELIDKDVYEDLMEEAFLEGRSL